MGRCILQNLRESPKSRTVSLLISLNKVICKWGKLSNSPFNRLSDQPSFPELRRVRNCSLLLALILFLGLSSCSDSQEVRPSFYHWKSRFSPGGSELDALQYLAVNRLYIRYFDVDLAPGGEAARPISKLQSTASFPDNTELVPCIFVTNRCMKALEQDAIPALAENIFDQIFSLQGQFDFPSPNEVQIDCDWTPSTQERYFSLLDHLRPLLTEKGCQLSCTIRLHQYKYPEQTGVPEVDRGMLMVYNVGNLDDPNEENSIFDLGTIGSYLGPNIEYPLPLDVALPIFGWGVLIREGKPIRLLNNLHLEDALTDSLLKKTGPTQVEVLQSHYFYGRYLYAGDKIRFESVSAGDLLAGARLVAEAMPKQANRYIALYHLDSLSIQKYALDTLEIVYRAFH